jgi:hypothetical protein
MAPSSPEKKPAKGRVMHNPDGMVAALALTCLETRVGFVDHINLATSTHDLTVFMPSLGGLQGRKDFHNSLSLSNSNQNRLRKLSQTRHKGKR